MLLLFFRSGFWIRPLRLATTFYWFYLTCWIIPRIGKSYIGEMPRIIHRYNSKTGFPPRGPKYKSLPDLSLQQNLQQNGWWIHKICIYTLYLFKLRKDIFSECEELIQNHSQDFKFFDKNDFGRNRTYLVISKPVNLQCRYQHTNNYHREKTKQRNDSTSQIKSIKKCRKSERTYSKSRSKEEKKHQQKICLVLSGD